MRNYFSENNESFRTYTSMDEMERCYCRDFNENPKGFEKYFLLIVLLSILNKF